MNTVNSKRNVTIKDLAKATDVSIATVSRVLNNISGCCSAETEARIREAAKKMGYTPNKMARSLVTQKTGLVAVLIPDIHYYFYQEFYTGLEEFFKQHGIHPILCSTLESAVRENEFIRNLSNGLVDGMIVSTLNSAENNKEILKLAEKKFPIVALERYGDDLDSLCNVRLDNCMSAEMAVDFLCKRGHKRIAFVSGPDTASNSIQRCEGYINGLKKNNLPVDERLIVYADYQFEKGLSEVTKLAKSEEFTALIAANDLMCLGACNSIIKLNKKIPEDISVIGLGNTAYLELYQPSLTAVSFHGYEMGAYAAECMKDLLDGKDIKNRTYMFKPTFKMGKSVRAI